MGLSSLFPITIKLSGKKLWMLYLYSTGKKEEKKFFDFLLS
jgi:hypothetical protein